MAKAGWGIAVLCKPQWVPVFQENPKAKAYGFGQASIPRAEEWLSLGRWLQKQKFSHLLIPHYDQHLFLASAFSGVKQRYAQFGGLLGRLTFHRCLRSGIRQNLRHMADVWLDFAREMGVPCDDGHPELFLATNEIDAVRQRVCERLGPGEYIVVHPFHGGSSCNWPPERYAELVKLLRRSTSYRIIITGSREEGKRWFHLGLHQDMKGDNMVWMSCGDLTLRELFAVVYSAEFIVCSSTGVLHVASALKVPAVSLFCPHPTVGPELWTSFSDGSRVVSPNRLSCSRFLSNSKKMDCHFREGMTLEDVFNQIKCLITSKKT